MASQLSLTMETQVLVRGCLRKQREHYRDCTHVCFGPDSAESALERSQLLGGRKVRFSGCPWDSFLGLSLISHSSLVAMMCWWQKQPSSHMESPECINSRKRWPELVVCLRQSLGLGRGVEGSG